MQWIVLLLKYEVFNILWFAGFLKKYRCIEYPDYVKICDML